MAGYALRERRGDQGDDAGDDLHRRVVGGYQVGVLGRGDNYKSPCKHMYVAEPNDVRAALKVVAVEPLGQPLRAVGVHGADDFTDARSPVY